MTAQDLGIAGNVLKIRANCWLGFLTQFCLEAENLLGICSTSCMSHEFSRLCGFQGLKLADLKALNSLFCSLPAAGKPIYLKDVLGGHCLEYGE